MRNATRRSERTSGEIRVSFGVGVRCGVPWAFDAEQKDNAKTAPNTKCLKLVIILISQLKDRPEASTNNFRPVVVQSTRQNWKRAASCRLRGGRTAVTAPKPVGFDVSEARLVGVVAPRAPLKVALTVSNCVWLKALNASRRNSISTFSLNRNRFDSDRSQLLIGEE